MKFRIESTLGWMMLSGLGNELVPGVFKPELFPGPVTAAMLHGSRRRGMSSTFTFDEASALHGEAALAAMGLKPERPEPEVRTYRTDSSLWWLSWASDESGCAGIAIVEVTGEQSVRAAMMAAERLDLVPAGAWQCAGVQIPEEHRAEHAPFVGRFLTTAEATAAFQAQSVKSFEAEQGIEIGDGELQAAGIEFV